MGGMGPAPNDGRRRRNATVPMLELPAEGRSGRTPKWPLPADVRSQALLGHLQEELAGLTHRAEAEEEGRTQEDDGEPIVKLTAAERRRLPVLHQRVVVLAAELEAQAKAEQSLWRELWKTPQAVAWERMRWTREVAQYVRWKVRAELGDLRAGAEARQLADRIGLTPLAMRRLFWKIKDDDLAAQRAARSSQAVDEPATSARPRFQVVDPNAVGE